MYHGQRMWIMWKKTFCLKCETCFMAWYVTDFLNVCMFLKRMCMNLFLSSYIFILIYLDFSALFLMFMTLKKWLAIAFPYKDKISIFSDPLISLFPFSPYSSTWHWSPFDITLKLSGFFSSELFLIYILLILFFDLVIFFNSKSYLLSLHVSLISSVEFVSII